MTDPPCPHCGETDPKRQAGIEIPTVYDGVIVWKCLSCGKHSPVIFPLSTWMSQRSIEIAKRMNGHD